MAFGKPVGVTTKKVANSSKGVAPSNRVSMDPDDAVSGGGLLGDVNVTVVTAEAVLFDYNGTVVPGTPALHFVFKLEDGTEVDTEYLSAGSNDYIQVSDDGNFFLPAEGKEGTGLSVNCNAMVFFRSLKSQGFPIDRLNEEGLSLLTGLHFHLIRVPKKDKSGEVEKNSKGYDKTTPACGKIITMPWEKKGAAGKGPGTTSRTTTVQGSPSQSSNGGNGNSVNDEAMAAVEALLKDGPVEMKKLGMQIFKSTPTSKNRAAIVKLVTTEDFITQDNAPWQFDGETLSTAE